MSQQKQNLTAATQAVLEMNDQGEYTIPAEGLYPHQWLWDSCFIAIGWRHSNPLRAQSEIISLLRGQWANGMIPHMIFAGDDLFRRDRNIWRSWTSPFAPDNVATSGITQPPVLAEAIVKIGEKLNTTERRSWYKQVYPALLKYHQWLYEDRDPHGEGLLLLVHPYECGLDNTPPWIHQLHTHHMPWWATVIQKTHLDGLINLVRRDTRHVPPGQRMSNIDALLYFDAVRRLRRKRYDIDSILSGSLFAIEDLTFNCIFIRANRHLRDIARTIRQPIPVEMLERMDKTEQALEQLWDPYSNQYFSRDFITHNLIKQPSIATLMPLYTGIISQQRSQTLVAQIENEKVFGPPYPLPSVPLNSEWFHPNTYWQGPTWLNTNWLIIDGLKRCGYDDHAAALTESSLELVQRSGCYEYFNPIDGSPAGAANFSWTAALALDLARTQQ